MTDESSDEERNKGSGRKKRKLERDEKRENVIEGRTD